MQGMGVVFGVEMIILSTLKSLIQRDMILNGTLDRLNVSQTANINISHAVHC